MGRALGEEFSKRCHGKLWSQGGKFEGVQASGIRRAVPMDRASSTPDKTALLRVTTDGGDNFVGALQACRVVEMRRCDVLP